MTRPLGYSLGVFFRWKDNLLSNSIFPQSPIGRSDVNSIQVLLVCRTVLLFLSVFPAESKGAIQALLSERGFSMSDT